MSQHCDDTLPMMIKRRKPCSILDLPLEITFNILEYVIPSEFYIHDIPKESNTTTTTTEEAVDGTATVEHMLSGLSYDKWSYLQLPSRLEIFNLFEELKNYLLVHRDLFYRNLMSCHCNRHFIAIWKKILFTYDIVYRQAAVNRNKTYCSSVHVNNLINQAKTGDDDSVQRLIGAVFSKFNGVECFLETFFKVVFRNEIVEYPSFSYTPMYEILHDIFNPETSIQKISYLKQLLDRFPAATQNVKYFTIVLRKTHSIIISNSLYSNEIKKIRKKTNGMDSRKLKELLPVLFSNCTTIPLEGNLEYLSLVLATTKVAGLDDLYNKLLSRWILNGEQIDSASHNLTMLIFQNMNGKIPPSDRFIYCVLESYLVRNQIDELKMVLSKLEKQNPTLISNGISHIVSIFFSRFEIFQQDIDASSAKIMSLIETCWDLCDCFNQNSFNSIVESLISSICQKALNSQDETMFIKLLEYFYFGLFSKRILDSGLLNMDSIISNSSTLRQAIQHPSIFQHLMKNMGNRNAYKQQLKNLCQDSTIFSSILACTAHYMGNSDGVTYSYKLRTESTFFNTTDLFKKRMILVKENLQNNSLFKKVLLDKTTKFNTDIESIQRYCSSFGSSVIPLAKTMSIIQYFVKNIV